MKNLDIAKKYEDYIISLRRHFHENPELSSQEEKTIARISQELDEMGIEYVNIPNGGILATVKGNRDNGKAVLLRADIDALPVQETPDNLKPGGRTCMSKVDGVMHACGHDGHAAMLLGAAKVLIEKKDEIEGTIYLCFERGEEATANYQYIFPYIDKNNIHIDSVFGIHLVATLETGKMGINDGGMMAGAMWYEIEIEGRGGHGSRPDLCVNPIDCFVAIYNKIESIRNKKIDPFRACTWSIGKVHSGTQGNIVPQKLTFNGTLRMFDRDEVGMVFRDELKKSIDNICAAYDCVPTYNDWPLPFYGVVNDPQCAQFARRVIGEELGTANVAPTEPWMGSETFAAYLLQYPGVFAFLGMKNEEKGVGAEHHNQAFDIDEDVLVLGSTAAATYALEFLKADHVTDAKGQMTFKEFLENSGTADRIPKLYGEE